MTYHITIWRALGALGNTKQSSLIRLLPVLEKQKLLSMLEELRMSWSKHDWFAKFIHLHKFYSMGQAHVLAHADQAHGTNHNIRHLKNHRFFWRQWLARATVIASSNRFGFMLWIPIPSSLSLFCHLKYFPGTGNRRTPASSSFPATPNTSYQPPQSSTQGPVPSRVPQEYQPKGLTPTPQTLGLGG